jgi:hypothetical protein
MVGRRRTSSSARLFDEIVERRRADIDGGGIHGEARLAFAGRSKSISKFPRQLRKAARRRRNTDRIDGQSDRRLRAIAVPNARPQRVACVSGPTT